MLQKVFAVLMPILVLTLGVGMMGLMLDVNVKKLCKWRKIMTVVWIVFMAVLNVGVCLYDSEMYIKYYTLFGQLPLFILLLIMSNRKFTQVLFSLLFTVIAVIPATNLRRSVLPNNYLFQFFLFFVIAALTLLIFYKFVRPVLVFMYDIPNVHFGLYCLVLIAWNMAYYFASKYSYYTSMSFGDLMLRIPIIVAGFLILYIMLLQFKETYQSILDKSMLENAENQINTFDDKRSELENYYNQASIYRHDTKHNLITIENLIANGNDNEAMKYIDSLKSDIVKNKFIKYCNIPAIDCILSHYISKAKSCNIDVESNIKVDVMDSPKNNDISTIIGNALENAINAQSDIDNGKISISLFTENDKYFLEVKNLFDKPVEIVDNLPVSHTIGHGIGTKSIALLVEKNNGIYSFKTDNDYFIFMCSI